MSTTIAEVRLRELYARIPTFECKVGCTDCCGPVPGSPDERRRVSGLLPAESADDAATILEARVLEPGVPFAECVACPHAAEGCRVYSDRPFMCRLFGTAPDDPMLRCPHGCQPDEPLTPDEADELVEQYRELVRDEAGA